MTQGRARPRECSDPQRRAEGWSSPALLSLVVSRSSPNLSPQEKSRLINSASGLGPDLSHQANPLNWSPSFYCFMG
jgi:hypothetical protein